MATKEELIDELIKGYQKPEDIIGENPLLKQLTKALVERVLKGELTQHLGYGKNEEAAAAGTNRRNGSSRKTLTGDFGKPEIAVPRDPEGTFEPRMVATNPNRAVTSASLSTTGSFSGTFMRTKRLPPTAFRG